MDNKKTPSKNAVRNNFWMMKQIYASTPSYIILTVVFGVVWGIGDSVAALYSKTLLDYLSLEFGFDAILNLISFYAVYLLVVYVFNNWYNQVFVPYIRERLHIKLHTKLFRQGVSLDLERYDDPEFYNDYIWAMDETYQRSTNLVEDTGRIINRIIGSFTLVLVLFTIDTTIALVILFASILRIIIVIFDNKLNRKFFEENNILRRKDEYIKRVHLLPDYAKDLRISRVRELLSKEYDKNNLDKNDLVNKYAPKRILLRFLSVGLPSVAEILIYVLMVYKIVVTGTLTLGGLAVAINSVWKVAWFFRDLVTRVMRFHEHGIFIEKIIAFVNCEPKIMSGKLDTPQLENLEIKNLSFAYMDKGEKVYALKNVDLKINFGEKIAIVGYNGAGKTTLTKLLMRLYDAESGEIKYNGTNIKEFKIDSLRNHVAAVFQDYRIFAGSIAENVVGGEYDKTSKQKVLDALKKSVFSERLSKMKNGIETVLTREFDDDGVELSGGEQQKIAIARAFYKDADLIILDEPSSALDPDAEYELNRAISGYAKDKTVIFISHRLSTTRHADRIYMFSSGEIKESGTHEELIKKNGEYAYMFNLQAEKYRREQEDKN